MDAPHTTRHHHRGFTLIELVIAMVITAILVALAFPSLMGSIRKGRRSEAVAALTALQQEQERWRSNNPQYTNSLTSLRINATTAPGGYYALSFVGNAPDATSYEAMADGSSSSQAADGQCAKLAVKVDRGSISYASCSSCSTFTYAPADPCWAR